MREMNEKRFVTYQKLSAKKFFAKDFKFRNFKGKRKKARKLISKSVSIRKKKYVKKQFAKKSKEYSDLNEIIKYAKEYENFEMNKKDLESIIQDDKNDKEITKV